MTMTDNEFIGTLEPQLEAFLKNWLDAQIGKLTRSLVLGAIVFTFGLGLVYSQTQTRIAALEKDIAMINDIGTRYERTLREDIVRLQSDLYIMRENIQDIRNAVCGEGPCTTNPLRKR